MTDEEKPKWSYCPECGSDKIHHAEGDHKQCAVCFQEWFADIDYTDVVQKNLANRHTLTADKAKLVEALKPLAERAERFADNSWSAWSDNVQLWQDGNYQCSLTVGDIRRAAKVIEETK